MPIKSGTLRTSQVQSTWRLPTDRSAGARSAWYRLNGRFAAKTNSTGHQLTAGTPDPEGQRSGSHKVTSPCTRDSVLYSAEPTAFPCSTSNIWQQQLLAFPRKALPAGSADRHHVSGITCFSRPAGASARRRTTHLWCETSSAPSNKTEVEITIGRTT